MSHKSNAKPYAFVPKFHWYTNWSRGQIMLRFDNARQEELVGGMRPFDEIINLLVQLLNHMLMVCGVHECLVFATMVVDGVYGLIPSELLGELLCQQQLFCLVHEGQERS